MSRSASARLFAALDPPSELAGGLAEWARAASRAASGARGADLRVLAASSLHLTLVFLGERPIEEIEQLEAALRLAAESGRPCQLEVGAPVWLPPRRPSALAVEVHDRGGDLERLQLAVATALSGIAGDRRPSGRRFRAHITVARTRGAARPDTRMPLPATPQLGFRADEVVLYRSRLDPAGARYERLAGAPLSDCGG
ncbi:MAG: RNA 2',3'-cyclic phosphodiesterase [Solirubrobacteraceae bacterium]